MFLSACAYDKPGLSSVKTFRQMRSEILQGTREAITACAADVGKICTTLMGAVTQGQQKIRTLEDLLTKETHQRRKLFNEVQVCKPVHQGAWNDQCALT